MPRGKNIGTLPDEFWQRLKEIFGSDFAKISASFVKRPTTFRVNTLKARVSETQEILRDSGFKVKPVSWCKEAFVLRGDDKRELSETDLYLNGKIYFQSLASMVPPLVLDPRPGEKVLDLTAAPGSKTSQIAAMMEKKGELVANDFSKVRFFKLKHNLDLLGATDEAPDWKIRLYQEEGSHLCGEFLNYFDKVLLDAPCSAEARIILSDPKTFGYWKEKKIREMADKQRPLLFSAWRAVRPGGILVYSTCTFSPEENECQISKFLSKNPDAEPVAIDLAGIVKAPIVRKWKEKIIDERLKHSWRILPTSEMEGFFVVKMRKKE